MAKGFELEGRIHQIDDVQTFGSGFTKREFVVEVEDGKFPQMIKFEAVKDKTAITDKFDQGDEVRVFFDIRGNEYKGRYYVNLNAWKLDKAGAAGGQQGGERPSYLDEPPPGFDEGDAEDPF